MSGSTWWQHAVIYEIHPRSFADGDGDGIGDIEGVRSRLPYLRDLGVDAVWFTPWYVSPLADAGYDVADYRRIDPVFGSLVDAEAFIHEAREFGIRTIVDIVPNHVSSDHPWFRAALAAGAGSEERKRFWFRDGRGPDGAQIPTHWVSDFQGSTWTRTVEPDGSPGEWYLHLFTPEQPDLNWSHPEVRAEFEDILRFWFDRGVAGIRVDSAALLVKDPELPEVPSDPRPGQHPFVDRNEVHDIYRSWRRVADTYDEPGVLVGEVWLPDTERFADYLRPDEMHMAFNFDFMTQPWGAARMRESIDRTLAAHQSVGAPTTWVLSNHDVTRPVTRYGRSESGFAFQDKRFGIPTDLTTGTLRARAAFLLVAALPGCVYVYQGEELGLPEDEELPAEAIEDPMHFRSGGIDPGRDGCRVPLPWTADRADSHGFSTGMVGGRAERSWLPQPEWWGKYAVDTETTDGTSTLNLYRAVIAARRNETDLVDAPVDWLELGDDVLAFDRGDLTCIVNLGDRPIPLPPGRDVVLASAELYGDRLSGNTAVWLRRSSSTAHHDDPKNQ